MPGSREFSPALPQHRDFTAREVARFLRIGLTTVYEMVHAGKLPAYRTGRVGWTVRIPRQAFWEWYAQLLRGDAHAQAHGATPATGRQAPHKGEGGSGSNMSNIAAFAREK